MAIDLHGRLNELGLALPSVAKPIASYVPAVCVGSRVIVSGQLPMREGELVAAGSVSSEVSLEQAQQAARQCVLNGLAAIGQALGEDWSRFDRLVRLGVYVNSDSDFQAQHQVANGASDLIGELLGEAGVHARSAVGVAALPLNAAVELELEAAATMPGDAE